MTIPSTQNTIKILALGVISISLAAGFTRITWAQTVQTASTQQIEKAPTRAAGTKPDSSSSQTQPLPGIKATTASVAAPVTVKGAWTRATVPGQMATGAFMQLTASEPLKLVSVSTPAAGIAEVHETKMDGNVMRMRPVVGGLDLPKGQTLALKPGGYHLMLMDLKGPLPIGSQIPVTFQFENSKGARSELTIAVPVSIAAPAAVSR